MGRKCVLPATTSIFFATRANRNDKIDRVVDPISATISVKGTFNLRAGPVLLWRWSLKFAASQAGAQASVTVFSPAPSSGRTPPPT